MLISKGEQLANHVLENTLDKLEYSIFEYRAGRAKRKEHLNNNTIENNMGQQTCDGHHCCEDLHVAHIGDLPRQLKRPSPMVGDTIAQNLMR